MKRSGSKAGLIWIFGRSACVAIIAFTFVYLHASEGGLIDGPADRIVVAKQAHTLKLYRQGKVLKTYRVALGRGGIGPKLQAGDNRVPEGVYRRRAKPPQRLLPLAEGRLSNSRAVAKRKLVGLDPVATSWSTG